MALISAAPVGRAAGQSAIRVVVNGSPLSLPVPPFVRDGQVMIPAIRSFESFGAGAAWVASDRAVVISNRTGLAIRLRIGEAVAQVNGQPRVMPTAPVLAGDQALVPAQFIFAALGAWVRYDEESRTLHVASQITALRVQRAGEGVRVVLDATGPLRAETRLLPNPERLVVDLHGGALRATDQDLPVGYAGVVRIRAAQFQAKPYITRVVFDLQQPVDVRVSTAATTFAMTLEVLPKGVVASAPPSPPAAGASPGGTSTPAPSAPAPAPSPQPVRPPDPGPPGLMVDDPHGQVFAPQSQEPQPDDGTLRILEVRVEQFTGRLRVVIQGTRPFEYTVRELLDPDRVVVDIQGAVFVPVKQEIPVAGAAVAEVRAAQFSADPDVTRVVVVLRRKSAYTVVPGSDGNQVAIEIPDASVRAHVVAIDAGHGGRDMGATGPTGLLEKDVVLDIALRAREILVGSGVRVVMTRETDVFVDLAERPRTAKRQSATVFVSIHANASVRAAASGAETYHLSPQSLVLAQMVQEELGRITSLVSRGVKTANFLVLRESDVPAVLVEVAYISNPEEESRLRTPAFRQRLAEAIARGVQRFLAVYPVPAH